MTASNSWSDLLGEEFNLFHLDRIAFDLSSSDFAFRGVDSELIEGVHLLLCDRVTTSVRLHEPVDDEVRIAADRRGEVRVEVEGEPEVADIACGVDRLAHRAERRHLYEIFFRLCLSPLREAC